MDSSTLEQRLAERAGEFYAQISRLLSRAPLLVVGLIVILTIANPGYYSHDELQWGYFSSGDSLATLPWPDWLYVESFQYRPLTFSLWLLASHYLFDWPQAFHALVIGLSVVVSWLLYGLLLDLSIERRIARAATLVFYCSPFVVFVHGWIATLADILWVGLGLACARLTLSVIKLPIRVVLIAALTTLALLAKEHAVVIPALLSILWWHQWHTGRHHAHQSTQKPSRELGQQRNWRLRPEFARDLGPMLAAALPVAGYLLLRLPILLGSNEAPQTYSFNLLTVPSNYFNYLLFPSYVDIIEVQQVALKLRTEGNKILLMAVAIVALSGLALWKLRGSWMLPLAAVAALAPVLVLPSSANQYGYGLSAVIVIYFACAYSQANRLGRAAALTLAVCCSLHGAVISYEMHQAGKVAARFLPAAADKLQTSPTAQLRLGFDCGERHWLIKRLTHDIPAYQGVRFEERIALASDDEQTNATVDCRGRINQID